MAALKVGIMSMRRIRNYGSFLQAYGLRRLLESLGCEVRFVDYHPGRCLVESRHPGRLPRSVAKLTEVLGGPGPLAAKLAYANLSVISKRPFASIVRTAGYGNAEKLSDLLRRLNFENRAAVIPSDFESLLDSMPDWKPVRFRVVAGCSAAIGFPKSQLRLCEVDGG